MARHPVRFLVLTLVLPLCGCSHDAADTTKASKIDAVHAPRRPLQEYIDAARRALERDKLEDALQATIGGLDEYPDASDLLITAGEASAGLGRITEALQYYERASQAEGVDRMIALGAAGDLYWQTGHLQNAEEQWRRLVAEQPSHVVVQRRLAWLMITEGRRWESRTHLLQLVKLDAASFEDLLFLGRLEEVFDDTPHLTRCEKAAPQDPFPHLGLARLDFYQEEFDDARQHLSRVIELAPTQLEAHVMRGRMLSALGSSDKLPEWNRQLPEAADNHPDVWLVRARWSESEGNDEAAIRAYLEVLSRNPNQQHACYALSQLLAKREAPEAAEFARRAEQLDLLRMLIKDMIVLRHPKPAQVEETAQLMENLGRTWEAWAWLGLLARDSNFPAARSERIRLRSMLETATPQTAPPAALARLHKSDFPLPKLSGGHIEIEPQAQTSIGKVDFRDEAEQVGIEFLHTSGHDPQREGMRMHEPFGGGVAAIDFDQDGWPDLYFVQACPFPVDPQQQNFVNRFYRNEDGQRFREVTLPTGTGDNGYGQGATIGDLNADGFPDLYVANIGRNRLYLNHGDGTFTEAAEAAGLESGRWTTSVLMADLTGDGLPDLYDACYLAGDPYELTCPFGPEQIHRVCRPTDFPAESDEFFMNNGDGSFSPSDLFAVREDRTGRGLGILAADFSDSGKLDLFIANDMTANFFFRNSTSAPDQPGFEEQGVISGCAFDGRGVSQACMGVAVADYDRDLDLDFHVTNYYNEFNTVYSQEASHFFSDNTALAGLRESTLKMLAFGTQFIDAELDGWPDVVVTNGHLDDFRFEGKPYRMRPQFFQNRRGKLIDLEPRRAGSFFDGENLGRALARLDWNRDGREDFVVTHLDAPAALVTNHTEPQGKYLALRLRGVTSNRDAIGTRIRVRSGDNQWVSQHTAGDGYYVSNQRQIFLGLGDVEKIDELQVAWPSGATQRFTNVPVSTHLLLVEQGELHEVEKRVER